MKTIKKLLFVSVACAFLLQSCSTGHMFSKKRYGHLNWIDHDTKVETAGNEKTPENKTPVIWPKKTNEPVSTIPIATGTQNENQDQQTAVTPVIEMQPVNGAQKQNTQQDYTTSKNATAEVVPEEKTDESTTVDWPLHVAKPDAVKSVKNTKEGSVGELLLMAVLIALALVLFFLLDSALGGILSLILIIFIILVLLRYFGVI
ncbi:MAG TPA: hypothetical protein VD905_14830 [Flavobacteriales bacterium]|nr:hypothetical protein [Flavobacteriales bacterium]